MATFLSFWAGSQRSLLSTAPHSLKWRWWGLLAGLAHWAELTGHLPAPWPAWWGAESSTGLWFLLWSLSPAQEMLHQVQHHVRCEVLLLSLIPRWRAVTTAGPRCHRPWDPSSSSWEQQPMGSDKLKPSFIKISSKIGCAAAWCSSCASVLSAFPDRRMWQMQNPSSVKIFVKLTHFKYLEERISSVKALC